MTLLFVYVFKGQHGFSRIQAQMANSCQRNERQNRVHSQMRRIIKERTWKKIRPKQEQVLIDKQALKGSLQSLVGLAQLYGEVGMWCMSVWN